MDEPQLERYRAKRDFRQTPEPEGRPEELAVQAPRFVVQEHHARALHWDFRLEKDGVLPSWAVPKGIPLDAKTNHLAVQTEDHPLEYLDFSGEIPEKQYGAGVVTLWDRGTYELHKWQDDEVMVTLHGRRLEGKYVLFRTGGSNWLIHRMDPPVDTAREPMPKRVKPMLAQPSDHLPHGTGWAFEVKWDGIRAIAYIDGGRLRLESRNGNDITADYPELRPLAESLGSLSAVLDGEIVAFDENGVPSFGRLQRRLGVRGRARVERAAAATPVQFVIFDLLYLDGRITGGLTYADRRKLLESLELAGPHWQTPARLTGDPRTLLEATTKLGLEGVIAKRTSSTYEQDRRSGAWVKVKNHLRQHFVVGGWLQRENATFPTVGALLLGYFEGGSEETRGLRFAGRVGTGMTDQLAQDLGKQLILLEQAQNPFVPLVRAPTGVRFVRPQLVVDVEFSEWTADGVLRHPSLKGLRPDVPPAGVTRE